MTAMPTRSGGFEQTPYFSGWYELLRERLGAITCHQLGIYVIPDNLLLSVVMPAYNERNTIQEAVDRVRTGFAAAGVDQRSFLGVRRRF
jgi:hypothetical protein